MEATSRNPGLARRNQSRLPARDGARSVRNAGAKINVHSAKMGGKYNRVKIAAMGSGSILGTAFSGLGPRVDQKIPCHRAKRTLVLDPILKLPN